MLLAVSAYPLVLLYSQLLLQPYLDGCVDSANGTLLTSNAAALLYDGAMVEGELYQLALTAAFDARATADCARQGQAGLANFVADSAQTQRADDGESEAAVDVDAIRRCVDPQSFNASRLSSPTSVSLSLSSPLALLSAQSASRRLLRLSQLHCAAACGAAELQRSAAVERSPVLVGRLPSVAHWRVCLRQRLPDRVRPAQRL